MTLIIFWLPSHALPIVLLFQVVENVTGVDFTAAYKLGNGRVSDVFERLLAARIPVETRALLMLPVRINNVYLCVAFLYRGYGIRC